MAKKLKCARCGVDLGEMTKGKIRRDAVMYCGKCNREYVKVSNDISKLSSQEALRFFTQIWGEK